MENKTIPYYAFDCVMAMVDRITKRYIIALIICILLLVVSNGAWLYAWMQYDYVSETVEVDSDDGGNANYIGHDGDINNGESESN